MDGTDIEDILKSRLRGEIERRGRSRDELASSTRIPRDRITRTVYGRQEISLEDLELLCHALRVNSFWILDPDYKPCRTIFRNLSPEALSEAQDAENVFTTLSEYLPEPAQLDVPHLDTSDRHYSSLLRRIREAARKFRSSMSKCSVNPDDPLDIFSKLQLLVFPVRSRAFEAFLMATGDTFALAVSDHYHQHRVRFSLFHELAHYLFHRDHVFPVENFDDTYRPKYYARQIPEQDVAEFVANKFAEFMIIPPGQVEHLWTLASWDLNKLDVQAVQTVLRCRDTSVNVLAHCLYDALRVHGESVDYQRILNFLSTGISTPPAERWTNNFFGYQRNRLNRILQENRDDFSEEALSYIRRVLGIPQLNKVMNG
jgi:hypothetical protein